MFADALRNKHSDNYLQTNRNKNNENNKRKFILSPWNCELALFTSDAMKMGYSIVSDSEQVKAASVDEWG